VWHKRLQITGLLLATVGFALIAIAFNRAGKTPFALPHHQLGLAVMSLGWLQPLNAFCRPHVQATKTRARQLWEYLHKGSGYGATALGLVNVLGGFSLPLAVSIKELSTLRNAWVVAICVAVAGLLSKALLAKMQQLGPAGEARAGFVKVPEDGGAQKPTEVEMNPMGENTNPTQGV
jgi:hypothetical protein